MCACVVAFAFELDEIEEDEDDVDDGESESVNLGDETKSLLLLRAPLARACMLRRRLADASMSDSQSS